MTENRSDNPYAAPRAASDPQPVRESKPKGLVFAGRVGFACSLLAWAFFLGATYVLVTRGFYDGASPGVLLLWGGGFPTSIVAIVCCLIGMARPPKGLPVAGFVIVSTLYMLSLIMIFR